MENYNVIRSIGKGSYGKVYLVRHVREKVQYVMKAIKLRGMPKREREMTQNEVDLMQRLPHPNIVGFKEHFLVPGYDQLCIVMTYCDGGDMAGRIERQRGALLKESTIMHWFCQLALGLQYMHQNKVLHRDIKTQNIFLLGNGRVVLGDLGVSKMLDAGHSLAETQIGTPYYMSPEVFKSKPYDYKSDVWSIGCVLYELCSLKKPFEGTSLAGLAGKIMNGQYEPIHHKYSRGLRRLVDQQLLKSPSSRPTMDEVLKSTFMRRHLLSYIKDVASRASRGGLSAGEGTLVLGRAMQSLAAGALAAELGPSGQSLASQLAALQLDGLVQRAAAVAQQRRAVAWDRGQEARGSSQASQALAEARARDEAADPRTRQHHKQDDVNRAVGVYKESHRSMHVRHRSKSASRGELEEAGVARLTGLEDGDEEEGGVGDGSDYDDDYDDSSSGVGSRRPAGRASHHAGIGRGRHAKSRSDMAVRSQPTSPHFQQHQGGLPRPGGHVAGSRSRAAEVLGLQEEAARHRAAQHQFGQRPGGPHRREASPQLQLERRSPTGGLSAKERVLERRRRQREADERRRLAELHAARAGIAAERRVADHMRKQNYSGVGAARAGGLPVAAGVAAEHDAHPEPGSGFGRRTNHRAELRELPPEGGRAAVELGGGGSGLQLPGARYEEAEAGLGDPRERRNLADERPLPALAKHRSFGADAGAGASAAAGGGSGTAAGEEEDGDAIDALAAPAEEGEAEGDFEERARQLQAEMEMSAIRESELKRGLMKIKRRIQSSAGTSRSTKPGAGAAEDGPRALAASPPQRLPAEVPNNGGDDGEEYDDALSGDDDDGYDDYDDDDADEVDDMFDDAPPAVGVDQPLSPVEDMFSPSYKRGRGSRARRDFADPVETPAELRGAISFDDTAGQESSFDDTGGGGGGGYLEQRAAALHDQGRELLGDSARWDALVAAERRRVAALVGGGGVASATPAQPGLDPRANALLQQLVHIEHALGRIG